MRRSAIAGGLFAALLLSLAGCGLGQSHVQPAAAAPAQIQVQPAAADAVQISRPATDVPPPINRSAAQTVQLHLTTREVEGVLDDGTTYQYWTFDGKVPGPMLRVRQGDTVQLSITNDPSSKQVHSVDLHAVSGPGGGAVGTQVQPGETKSITFEALNPGVYVYHCASPHIPTHITNGMYGLIVVEPAGGLAPVDHEFYVMQGELYTQQPFGTKGELTYDGQRLLDERPTYVVYNGAVGALTGKGALQAKVGDRIRIFVGNAGPNLISSFHIIGMIMDQVHNEGASEAESNVQTTLIPAGGAAWLELTAKVPGTYTLLDHSITRAIDQGAVGQIVVTGPANPAIFSVPTGQEMTAH